MNYIEVDEWIPADGLKLEDNALSTVKSTNNTLVVAGPGSGKTELLAQKACYLLETNTCSFPKKILAISFKKDAAHNLKERVNKRCGEILSRRFESLTFDAFSKILFDRFNKGLPEEYCISGSYEIEPDERFLVGLYKSQNNDYFNNLQNIDIIKFHNSCLPHTSDSNSNISKKIWLDLLKNKSLITFKMLMRLAQYIIKLNPLIKEYLQETYEYVFLDEFQDTTFMQYDFLSTCFNNSKSIFTAVGDDKQRIMLWAGANPSIFSIFLKDKNARILKLKMNFRSAPKLIKLQNYLVKHLLKKDNVVEPTTDWKGKEGEAFVWVYKNHEHEFQHLLIKISEWISGDGLQPRDICILVKQQLQVYAGDLIEYFNKNGLKARDENNLQDLLTEEIIIFLSNVILYICSPTLFEEKTNSLNFLAILNSEIQDDQLLKLEIKFNKFTQNISQYIKTEECVDTSLIIDKILEYADTDKITTLFPNYQNKVFFNNLITKFKDEINKNYTDSNDLENSIFTFLGKDTIPVMTIHKSKGLEYNTTIFIGLEDNAFWSFEKQPDEDKCAFFVALSRAKERIIITYCQKRHDKWGRERNQSFNKIKVFFDELTNSKLVEMKVINDT